MGGKASYGSFDVFQRAARVPASSPDGWTGPGQLVRRFLCAASCVVANRRVRDERSTQLGAADHVVRTGREHGRAACGDERCPGRS